MNCRKFLALIGIVLLATVASAQPASLVVRDAARHQSISVTAITPDILRVSVTQDGVLAPQLPTLLSEPAQSASHPQLTITRTGGDTKLLSTSSGMRAIVDEKAKSVAIMCGNTLCVTDLFDRENGTVRLQHPSGESFYGAGERGLSFNLMGDTLVNYNAQNYGYQGGESRTNQMGITMPMVISSRGYGIFFDDFCRSTLIVGEDGLEYSTTRPAPVSYYIINGNGKVDEVVKNFTWLVGRQDLPPLWTLGYITSKYGYRDQRESEATVDTLKREGYPLDGIVFDLYWYGKEEDMGRLEWDKEQWPDHRKMLADFKRQGVNVVTISQPYVLTNGRAIDNFRQLDRDGLLCKTAGTDTTQNVVIWVGEGGMFDVSNPATRQWLSNRYKQLTDEGVTGWWGDLGEPEKHPLEICHNNGLTAEQYHNLYGNDWSSIIYDMFKSEFPDRRLMTMMRAGTAGLQRYSVFPWSTDVSRSWGGLAPQVNIMLNTGLSGLGYMSHDVGGFAVDPENKRDGELYIRWLQLGLFSPVLRTHSTYQAEPYNYKEFGDLTLRIIRERYNWLPYNYTLAWENASMGLPLVRPLGLYEAQNGIRQYDDISDQYLWGRDVMVAPVMTQGATQRTIAFPDGEWVDYNNPSKRFAGHTITVYPAPIDVLPLFVRAGAFLPRATGHMENVGDYNPDQLDIVYYHSNAESSYTLFDDDMHSTGTLAEGKHRLIHFVAKPLNGGYEITITPEGNIDGTSIAKQYQLVMPDITAKPRRVTINGKNARFGYDKAAARLTVAVSVAAPTTITIQ